MWPRRYWISFRRCRAEAAALALPDSLADGTPFPHRDLIIFFMPRLLNFIVAAYLIIVGLIGLLGASNYRF